LKLADRLEAAGMPAAQARGTAAALAETMTGAGATAADVAAVRAEIRESEVRLRGDIRESEDRLRGDIRESESRLRIEIADLRAELLKWVIGAIGFQTVIIIGAVAGLIRLLHRGRRAEIRRSHRGPELADAYDTLTVPEPHTEIFEIDVRQSSESPRGLPRRYALSSSSSRPFSWSGFRSEIAFRNT
jgi:hypothetical protein